MRQVLLLPLLAAALGTVVAVIGWTGPFGNTGVGRGFSSCWTAAPASRSIPSRNGPCPKAAPRARRPAPSSPFATIPAPVGNPLELPEVWALSDIVSFGHCSRERERYLYEGIYTPPSEQGTLFFPGTAGATNWGGVPVDPHRGILYVNASRIVQLIRLIPREESQTRKDRSEAGYSRSGGPPTASTCRTGGPIWSRPPPSSRIRGWIPSSSRSAATRS